MWNIVNISLATIELMIMTFKNGLIYFISYCVYILHSTRFFFCDPVNCFSSMLGEHYNALHSKKSIVILSPLFNVLNTYFWCNYIFTYTQFKNKSVQCFLCLYRKTPLLSTLLLLFGFYILFYNTKNQRVI